MCTTNGKHETKNAHAHFNLNQRDTKHNIWLPLNIFMTAATRKNLAEYDVFRKFKTYTV
jgi:hypothetical protein